MHELVMKESGFNPYAQNPKSTAYGLLQFLDDTWENYGCKKTNDFVIQTECGMKYIKLRYGTPTDALIFWNLNHWY